MEGMISNIQKFSIDDGPGIRTTVFFKGCNLHCLWCHNPETIRLGKDLQFLEGKCNLCGNCSKACPNHVHAIKNGERILLRDLCESCGNCIEHCPTGALISTGKTMSVEEVIKEIEKDRPFYETSGGGVTLSGGECLLQRDFAGALLKQCKNQDLHTAVDTAGNVPWKVFETVLPYVDLFLYDMKLFDRNKHKAATGVDNDLILSNLIKLSDIGKKIWIRIPIIPGINSSTEDINETADFIEKLKFIDSIELLPYHNLGEGKYKSVGMEYKLTSIKPPTEELMNSLIDIFDRKGLNIKR